jgi:hypothetical protein
MINSIKLREFEEDNLAEAFVDHCLHVVEFLLTLEKSPTSSLEMSYMIVAEFRRILR